MAIPKLIVAICCVSSMLSVCGAIRWQHSTHLDPNFRLLWNLDNAAARITIELQVRTHGYVGIGFARSASDATEDDYRAGADVTIGWVAGGQTYLQDRHYKSNGAGEPRIDAADDCTLLLGYENATHTVLRFERALETCDRAHDVPITNHTMRVLYMYHELEPRRGSVAPGALPQPNLAYRGAVPLLLGQRLQHTDEQKNRKAAHSNAIDDDETDHNGATLIYTVELRNEDVPLPRPGESLQWCHMFELNAFRTKHHMVQFEPVFGSAKAARLLDRVVLYECQGSSVRLSALARDAGRQCHHSRQTVPCNAIVAAWTRGSEGFVFPAEAGIPFESSKERFYLMESHYRHQPEDMELADLFDDTTGPFVDDSGLRLHVTTQLREHDAGVLSVGMQPDWRHIIPPGQETVTSEGHCVDSCTRSAFPPAGIRIFAVLMRTHSIGKSVRLRQIRGHEELLPIGEDAAVHSAYAEYRRVEPAARVLPGDSMVVECRYDSTARETITVGGGGGPHGETCNVLAVYYPRQKKLTTCHSLPALPTILQSVGIEALMPSDTQTAVQIAAPAELAGMTLETRLLSYDWAQNFGVFERTTRAGAFQAMCRDAKKKTVMGTDRRLYRAPAVRRIVRPAVSQRRSKCMMEPASRMDEVRRLFEAEMGFDGILNEVYEVQSMGLSSGAEVATRLANGVFMAIGFVIATMLLHAFQA